MHSLNDKSLVSDVSSPLRLQVNDHASGSVVTMRSITIDCRVPIHPREEISMEKFDTSVKQRAAKQHSPQFVFERKNRSKDRA